MTDRKGGAVYIDQHALPKFLQLGAKERKRIIDSKVRRTAEYFRDNGYARAVLGLSGGIDSAVALAIAVRALGQDNVTAIMMPDVCTELVSLDELNPDSVRIAREVAAAVGLPGTNLRLHNIYERVLKDWEDLARDFGEPYEDSYSRIRQIAEGNLAARARGATLMHWGTMHRALVFGTENRTEHALAYYTKGGDDLTDFEPFLDLWKVQVFQIGAALGLPQSVLDRAPTAELWAGQTDENELGVPYAVIDTILAGTFDEGVTEEEFIDEYGIPVEQVVTVLGHVARMRGKRESPFPLDVPDHEALEFLSDEDLEF